MKDKNLLIRKLLMTIFSILLSLSFLISLPFMAQSVSVLAQTENSVTENDSNNVVENEILQGRQQVYSYMDVFEKYYNKCSDILKTEGLENPFSLEGFTNLYYDSNYNSIELFVEYVVTIIKENSIWLRADNDKLARGSFDANYLISAKYYDITPKSEFKRQPYYSDFDYSNIQLGDIIYEQKNGLTAITGHAAIITDLNKPSEYGKYIQTIEAYPSGVQYGFLDDSRMVEFGVIIVRPNNLSKEKKLKAIEFCKQQVGKKYRLNLGKPQTSINSSYWYCSELIYAAYNYVGLNIAKGSADVTRPGVVHPFNIYLSTNTSAVHVGSNFLELAIVSKPRWNIWRIRVTNHLDVAVNCEYNRKMCWFGDAQWWNHLRDIRTVYIPANSSVEVEVQENWAANAVTFSHWRNGKRHITYADTLTDYGKNNGGGLRQYYRVL